MFDGGVDRYHVYRLIIGSWYKYLTRLPSAVPKCLVHLNLSTILVLGQVSSPVHFDTAPAALVAC